MEQQHLPGLTELGTIKRRRRDDLIPRDRLHGESAGDNALRALLALRIGDDRLRPRRRNGHAARLAPDEFTRIRNDVRPAPLDFRRRRQRRPDVAVHQVLGDRILLARSIDLVVFAAKRMLRVHQLRTDGMAVTEGRESRREHARLPHVAHHADRIAAGDRIAVQFLRGLHVLTAEEQDVDLVRHLVERIARDVEPAAAAHRHLRLHVLGVMAPGETIGRIPILERRVGAHHRARLRAELVRHAELPFGDRHRTSGDARRRLDHRNRIAGVPLQIGGLIPLRVTVTRLRMVRITMVVHHRQFLTLIDGELEVPPVDARDEALVAELVVEVVDVLALNARALLDQEVIPKLITRRATVELELHRVLLLPERELLLEHRTRALLLDLSVGRHVTADRHQRILVVADDERQGRIVLPRESRVRIDVVHQLLGETGPDVKRLVEEREIALELTEPERLLELEPRHLLVVDAAHLIEVGRHVHALALEGRKGVVETIEHLRVNGARPAAVPAAGHQQDVGVVKADGVVAHAAELRRETVNRLLIHEIHVEVQVRTDEADALTRLLADEMSVLVRNQPSVTRTRRTVRRQDVREVDQRPLLDLVVETERHPFGPVRDLHVSQRRQRAQRQNRSGQLLHPAPPFLDLRVRSWHPRRKCTTTSRSSSVRSRHARECGCGPS